MQELELPLSHSWLIGIRNATDRTRSLSRKNRRGLKTHPSKTNIPRAFIPNISVLHVKVELLVRPENLSNGYLIRHIALAAFGKYRPFPTSACFLQPNLPFAYIRETQKRPYQVHRDGIIDNDSFMPLIMWMRWIYDPLLPYFFSISALSSIALEGLVQALLQPSDNATKCDRKVKVREEP